MIIWSVIIRIVALSGERLAVHGLGRGEDDLAVTLVSVGGAALCLWAGAVVLGQGHFTGSAFWPGAVYAVAFRLSTRALASGPVAAVSVWANAPVIWLYLLEPSGGGLALAGCGLFLIGGFWLLGGRRPPWGPVALMMGSGAFVVAGRLADVARLGLPPVAYAASLYTSVLFWLTVTGTTSAWADGWRLARQKPGWAAAVGVSNAVSYLALLVLLGELSPFLVEGISALAGLGATVAGGWRFREAGRRRYTVAALVMTVGTLLLLYDRRAEVGVK